MKAFKEMMEQMKSTDSAKLLATHRELKERAKAEPDVSLQNQYYVKMRQVEKMIKQDYYLRLDSEGRNITPEMGKSSSISQKKFIEDVKKDMTKRDELLK